jgi:hypothetical protein
MPRPDEAPYPPWSGVAPDSKMTLKDLELRASLDGPCRYRPEYAPQPYATRCYAREAAVR